MSNQSHHIRKVAISAIFLSLALVVRLLFSFYIPLFGAGGIRIGLWNVFAFMPSLFFGPIYGAIVALLFDLLGFMLRPSGSFLPMMTLVVTLGGFVRGFLWMKLKNKNTTLLRASLLLFVVALVGLGLLNMVHLRADGVDAAIFAAGEVYTGDMNFISRLLVERSLADPDPAASLPRFVIMVTSALIGSGAFAFVLFLADLLWAKREEKKGRQSKLLPLLITLLISGMLVNTLNTIVLREMLFDAWQLLPFFVVWLPRIIVEILTTVVLAYFIALLFGIFEKQEHLSNLIK